MTPSSPNEDTRVKTLLAKTSQFFKSKGLDQSPELDAQLLLSRVLKTPRIQLFVQYERELKPAEVDAYRALVRRRAKGEPVAYILGEKQFLNYDFRVNPAVLIPRPETEELAARVLKDFPGETRPGRSKQLEREQLAFLERKRNEVWEGLTPAEREDLEQEPAWLEEGLRLEQARQELAASATGQTRWPGTMAGEPFRVWDCCTGSGCLGLSLALERPDWKALLTDVSGEALVVARENATVLFEEKYGSETEARGQIRGRLKFLESDLAEKLEDRLRGKINLLVSNPPYVLTEEYATLSPEVRDFEPRLALELAQPREWSSRLFQMAREFLAPGAWFYFEGSPAVLPLWRELARETGLTGLEILDDMFGKQRFLRGRQPEKS